MQSGQLRRDPPPIQPSSIQKMLDENVRLIHGLIAHQRMGSAKEAAEFERVLHRNLIYLATIADRTTVQPASTPHPPPTGLPQPNHQIQGSAPNYPAQHMVNATPEISQQPVVQPHQITVNSSMHHAVPVVVGSTTISTVGNPIMYQQYLVSSHISNSQQVNSQVHIPVISGQLQHHERMVHPVNGKVVHSEHISNA